MVSWPQYSPLIGPEDEYYGQVSCDWWILDTHLWLVQGRRLAWRHEDEYSNGYVFTAQPVLPGERVVIQVPYWITLGFFGSFRV